MKKEMLINVLQPEECRIAIIEDGVLEELYVERANQESFVGNIYKGKIVNIEPSIQAAFVDFGTGRNGFLHVSDVDPAYYRHLLPKEVLEQWEAEQEEEFGGGRGGPRGGGRGPDRGRTRDRDSRSRDRGDRGERSDRGERREPVARDAMQPPPLPVTASLPVTDNVIPESSVGDDDWSGFGEGIEEGGDFVEVFEVVNEVEVIPAPPPLPKPPRPVQLAEPDVESGFASDLFDDPNSSGPISISFEERYESGPEDAVSEELPTEQNPEPGDSPEAVESTDEPTASDEPSRPRVKSRSRSRAKADEPAGDDAEAKPRKPGRRRKKDDDTGEAPAMPSAEMRTTPPDEPEIKPFFEEFGAGFDIDAPNDRFSESSAAADEPPIELVAEEKVEADEEILDETSSEKSEQELFDEQFAPKPMDDDRRRDRGDRGDRGGRSDRGPRGGGGPRGGPRDRRPVGGPGGPGQGSRMNARDRGLPRMPIEQIFKRGQEVIVQVIKDGIGTKGPTLSTFISIAGRYLVLMPHLSRIGVSRKIEDMSARRRLREIMNELEPPKGVGFIVRTAAIDRNPEELQSDLIYLLKLWQVVVKRIRKMPAPVEIYRESDIITRTIRDNFTSDIDTIWVDEAVSHQQAAEFMQVVMPRYADRIRFFDSMEPLFQKFRIEEEIAKINQKRIDLPRGGSIIIEQTEALVAIDVNSGNFRAENNAEETAYQMNLIAAREIARQLRLRDLGGVIVNDFIDMRSETHRRNVENALHDALKRDRARTKILRISQFGIIEMTRQRMQPSLKKRIYHDCPHCRGTAHVKNSESMGIDVMRTLQSAAFKAPPVASVVIAVHNEVAAHLLNKKRREIADLENRAQIEVTIRGESGVSPEHLEMKCFDGNGHEVRLTSGPPLKLGTTNGDDRGRGRGGRGRPQDENR